MSELLPVEQDVCNELEKTAEELYKEKPFSNKVWTERFNERLYKLAGEYDLQAWGHDAGERCPEWLFDICWAKLGRKKDDTSEYDWMRFRGLFLACEIEWGYSDGDLLVDFLKLSVVKADYRLFIFACHKPKEANEKFNLLMRHCPGSDGARYLAIAVPDSKHTELKSDNKSILLPRCAWTI
jgi:hypothetical protein